MSRYYEESEIMKLDSNLVGTYYGLVLNVNMDEFLDGVPTADVVEVVRCRDCTWWKSIFSWNGKEHKVCVRQACEPPRELNDYCSFGERREDEQIR